MTELKTLKDIEKLIVSKETHILYNALKQEAIKWVEEFLKEGNMAEAFAFTHFFNLTEEDLK